MASQQEIPLSRDDMFDYLLDHESVWQTMEEAEIFASDYGYEVEVVSKQKTAETIYSLFEYYLPSNNSKCCNEFATLVQRAVQGNILLCTSEHLHDVSYNKFVLKDCEPPTQCLFYFLTYKSGWYFVSVDDWYGTDFSSVYSNYFCMVRDPNAAALKALNVRLEELIIDSEQGPLGPPLDTAELWGMKEPTPYMEQLHSLVYGYSKAVSELESWKEKIVLHMSEDNDHRKHSSR